MCIFGYVLAAAVALACSSNSNPTASAADPAERSDPPPRPKNSPQPAGLWLLDAQPPTRAALYEFAAAGTVAASVRASRAESGPAGREPVGSVERLSPGCDPATAPCPAVARCALSGAWRLERASAGDNPDCSAESYRVEATCTDGVKRSLRLELDGRCDLDRGGYATLTVPDEDGWRRLWLPYRRCVGSDACRNAMPEGMRAAGE